MIEEMTAGDRQVRILNMGGKRIAFLDAMGGVSELAFQGESVHEAVAALYRAWRERE